MEFCYKQLFLRFTLILYLCCHLSFINLWSITLGEIYKVFKLRTPRRVVKAGSSFRRIKVTLQGKPSQPTSLQLIIWGKGEGQMKCSTSPRLWSVSTCGHTAGTGRDKCDLFSGNMSDSLRSISFEFWGRTLFCNLDFETKLSMNALDQIFLIPHKN